MSANRSKGSGLEWFVRRGGVVRGPFSSTRVRHFVLEDKLGLDDEVSADRKDWRLLGGVAEVVPLQMRTDAPAFAAEQDVRRRSERTHATRAIVVSLLVVVALTAAVSLVGRQPDEGARDCAAVPVPGVILEGCRLDGARMTAASLAGARLANASLAGANLSESDLGDADLRYADLTGADISYAKLDRANLKGASLRMADLTNTDLSSADLRFADLSGARLGGTRLGEAKLDGAIWTDGQACGTSDCPR